MPSTELANEMKSKMFQHIETSGRSCSLCEADVWLMLNKNFAPLHNIICCLPSQFQAHGGPDQIWLFVQGLPSARVRKRQLRYLHSVSSILFSLNVGFSILMMVAYQQPWFVRDLLRTLEAGWFFKGSTSNISQGSSAFSLSGMPSAVSST